MHKKSRELKQLIMGSNQQLVFNTLSHEYELYSRNWTNDKWERVDSQQEQNHHFWELIKELAENEVKS
jgi:ribonuclease HI